MKNVEYMVETLVKPEEGRVELYKVVAFRHYSSAQGRVVRTEAG